MVPTGPIDDAWRSDLDFNDSDWISGTGGVGYERLEPQAPTSYTSLFDIDVGDQMYEGNTTCYIRIPFALDSNDLSYLGLNIHYDDDFIAYINGERVKSGNFSGTPVWDSNTGGWSHEDSLAVGGEYFDISHAIGLLREGENLLAIHGLNSVSYSSDFLISVELVGWTGWIEAPDDPNIRDIELYNTVLSGDLAGNDRVPSDIRNIRSDYTRAENSYHVVTAEYVYMDTILDGLTITGGNASSHNGGGIFANYSGPTIIDCTFMHNGAYAGAAIFSNRGRLTISGCTFTQNGTSGAGA
ncbi:MAG: right-handed parallel beta-helix repeat-containing protein, partial [Planctomycetota bacterium]